MPHATNKWMRKALPPQSLPEGRKEACSNKHVNVSEIIANDFVHITCPAGFLKKNPAFFLLYLVDFSRRTWVKTLSLLLSFCILFTSISPAYGEALRSTQASRSQVGAVTEGAEVSVLASSGEAAQRAGALVSTVERGVAQSIFGLNLSMVDKLNEVKEVVQQIEETSGLDSAGAVVTVDRQTGKMEYDYGNVDVNKKEEVDRAFNYWYAEYLLEHEKELAGDIAAGYEASFNEAFDKEVKEAFYAGKGEVDEKEIDVVYEGLRREAFEAYKGAHGDDYTEYDGEYRARYKELMRKEFKKELKAEQAKAQEKAEEAAREEEAYLRGLIKEVWGYYYSKGYEGVLDYLAFEAMGAFDLAGLLEEKERGEVREYLRKVLKENGKYCSDVLADKSKVNKFFYGIDPTENSVERAAREAMEPCERAMKALAPMGIFGKVARGNDREDAHLVGEVMAGARDGLVGAGVFAVGTPVLVALKGDNELVDLLKWAPIPVGWRQDKTMKALGFTMDMLFHPVTTLIQDDARGIQNSWQSGSFVQNVEGSFYEEDGKVGNLFYDMGKALQKEAAGGDAFSKGVVERVMRLNLHFYTEGWNHDQLYPQMPLKMFVVGALAGGYKVDIREDDYYTTQPVKPRPHADGYGVVWDYAQAVKWHDAEIARTENWYCGRTKKVYNGGHLVYGLSQTGYVAYGLLQVLKSEQALTVKEREWVRGILAKIYNRELKKCDKQYELTQRQGLVESGDVDRFAKKHKYGGTYKEEYTAEENRAYAAAYESGVAKVERAKKVEGRSRRVGKWIDVVLLAWMAVDIGVGIVRGVLSGLRAGLFILRDAAAVRASGNILSRMRAVVKAQRMAKYGVEGGWKLLGERLTFSARRLKVKLTPAGMRTIAESEALAQMRMGYAAYLRGVGQKAGRTLSADIPWSAWDRARYLTVQDLPKVTEIPSWIKSVSSGENAPMRYAVRNGLYSLGEANAARTEAEEMLVSWARQNKKLIENKGYLYLNPQEKVPSYIGDALTGKITPQEAKSIQYAVDNGLERLGKRGELALGKKEATMVDWLDRNGKLIEQDGYLYVRSGEEIPIEVIDTDVLEGRLTSAQVAENFAYARKNGLMYLGTEESAVEGYGRAMVDSWKEDGLLIRNNGGYFVKPARNAMGELNLLDPARAPKVTNHLTEWETVSRHEVRMKVKGIEEGSVAVEQAKPVAQAKPITEAKPVTEAAPAANPYQAEAEAMAEAAQKRAAEKAAARKARIAKIDKYTFGLASKIANWQLGRHLRQGVTTVMTAGMLTAASPAVAVAESAPIVEQSVGTIARTSMLPTEGLILDPAIAEKGMPGVMSVPLPSFKVESRLLSVSEISSKLAAQQKAYAGFMQAKQSAQLARESVRMIAIREGLSPLSVKWRLGLYDISHVFSNMRLNVQEFKLRKNVYYQAYKQELAQRAAQTRAEDSILTYLKTEFDTLFFGEQILRDIEKGEVDFLNRHGGQYAFALLGAEETTTENSKAQTKKQRAKIAKQHAQQLRGLQNPTWQKFITNYINTLPRTARISADELLADPEVIFAYYNAAMEAVRNSDLPSAAKRIALHKWKIQLQQYLQKAIVLPKTENVLETGIPVFINNKLVSYWSLDDKARAELQTLRDNQRVYIWAEKGASQAEMYVRTYKNDDGTKYENTLIRSDIELTETTGASRQGKIQPTSFGWKKIVEGILLVNNRLIPLYGVYLMAGMGNVSSTISTFSKEAFSLANWETYAMGGISSVVMGLVSFVAGMLQTHWARNPDGTINGARGRNITMNIGMTAFILAMIAPMLVGMYGNLGDPTDLKKYVLLGSFALLGIGAAFMDVSMKPVVLAASRRGDYQALQGYLSVFKQTVGNAGNYLIPPIAMAIMSIFGHMADWTVFFPIYGALGLGISLLYNLSNMHQQTLETTERPAQAIAQEQTAQETDAGVLNNLQQMTQRVGKFLHIDELTGKKPYNKIIRHGVAATALHGVNMAALGLYVNQLFQAHVGVGFDMYANAGNSNVFAAVWESLSQSWLGQSLLFFTVPIIVGRFVGTYLMKHDLHVGGLTIPRLNNGSLLIASAAMAAAGVAGIAFGNWTLQIIGVVLAALGLTNVSPIVGGFTTDRTRHVSDAVSTLLSGTALVSFLGVTLFGWLKDLTASSAVPWLPLVMPLVFLGCLAFFGWEISNGSFDASQDKFTINSNAQEFLQDITQAELIPDIFMRRVWFLRNREGNISFVLKDVTANELERTKQLATLIQQNGLEEKYTDIDIEYPLVVAENVEGLSAEVQAQIAAQRKEVVRQQSRMDGQRGTKDKQLVMTVVDTQGISLDMIDGKGANLRAALRGQPVSAAEWESITGFYNTLNELGFEHTDIMCNLFLSRGADGRLKITLIDFENIYNISDAEGLAVWKKQLIKAGMLDAEVADIGTESSEASSWAVAQQISLSGFEQWWQENRYYVAGPVTKEALQAVHKMIQNSSSAKEAAEAIAVLAYIQTFTLGKNEEGIRKIVFKGTDPSVVSAKDFYMIQEFAGIPKEWVSSKKITHINTSISHEGTRISELKFEKRVSELAIQNLLRGIRDRSGLKVRMGSHELGINGAGYTQYKNGELHIHFESTVPDEQGILYNYRLKINAHAAVKGHKLAQLRELYLKWFHPFIKENEINWPSAETDASGNLLALGAGLMMLGWGLSKWLNAGSGMEDMGLLLGALPFLARPIGQAAAKPEPKWEDISQAKMDDVSHLVWRLTDSKGQAVAYAKYSTKRELNRTKQFGQLMDIYQWEQKYNLIHFAYPRVLAEDLSKLPFRLQHKIKFDRQAASIFNHVRTEYERSEVSFLLSVADIQGVTLRQWFGHPELIKEALRNIPITRQEWDQVCAFFNELHTAGFEHSDLANNLYFARTPDGKLQVSLIDFELYGGGTDELALQKWQKRLLNINMLEAESENMQLSLFDFAD